MCRDVAVVTSGGVVRARPAERTQTSAECLFRVPAPATEVLRSLPVARAASAEIEASACDLLGLGLAPRRGRDCHAEAEARKQRRHVRAPAEH